MFGSNLDVAAFRERISLCPEGCPAFFKCAFLKRIHVLGENIPLLKQGRNTQVYALLPSHFGVFSRSEL